MITTKRLLCIVLGLCGPFFALAADGPAPWPEHPRPDLCRQPWVSLNGTWAFEFDPQNQGEDQGWFEIDHALSGRITVPFPWESKLSGVGDTEYKGTAWYSRKIRLPEGTGWEKRNAWLVVGACDWQAKVWVNGRLAGEHVGGYLPFDVNLSQFAKPGEEVTVTIKATDVTAGHQPTGKQVGWYTRNSGIWQSVYLEPRGKGYIGWVKAVPDVDDGTVTLSTEVIFPGQPFVVTASSPEDEFQSAMVRGQPDHPIVELKLVLKNPQLWSPESPKLYPVRLHVGVPIDPKDTRDVVETYFGFREVSAIKAPGGDYQYIALNGEPVYLRGALHQSFHPEAIYQYPSDAVMRSDYELCKKLGINMLRIHIKTPVPRELYWADRLGVLIMQDIPNFWEYNEQATKWYEQLLEGAVTRDHMHPSVFSWVDFNETWGINHQGYGPERHKWVEAMYHRTRHLDSTRLVEDNSPCNYDHVITDINSWHFYINDYAAARKHIAEVVQKTFPGSGFNYVKGYVQGNQPLMNSEYGGIGAGQGDQDISWCFKYLTNELRLHEKICGYIYTELSDIEWEHNGFVNYDRTPKEYGYAFWCPGMSMADLNGPDFVVLDAPPVLEIEPGKPAQVPVKVSHWSAELGEPTLTWRTIWLDGVGERHEGAVRTRPVKWAQYRVTDQEPLAVNASAQGKVGALAVELRSGERVLARNYINLLAKRPASPPVRAMGPNRLALSFGTAEAAAWSFEAKVRQGVGRHKAFAEGGGAAEYHLQLPEGLKIENLRGLTILAELAAYAGAAKLDWPARTKPVDYPQTDVRKWPSDVVISVNGQELGRQTLPDDPADARGALSHFNGLQGGYGYLVNVELSGKALKTAVAALGDKRVLRIRFEVPADAKNRGGLSIYGEAAGCYPVGPTVLMAFDGGHGLGGEYASQASAAIDQLRLVLVPTAETQPRTWKYATEKPGPGWMAPEFDDSAWKSGPAGFGTPETPGAIVGTAWNTADIWARTEFTVADPAKIGSALLRLHHDDDAEVYVNGVQAVALRRFSTSYEEQPLSAEARSALKPGKNTLAVHCKQKSGGQYIDVGLTAVGGGSRQ